MKDKIKYLFLQYYHNRSSRKELEDFFRVINSAKYDQDLNDLVKMVYAEIKQTEPSLTSLDEQGNLVLKEPDWIQEQNAKIRPLNKRYPLMIAASILILIGFGTFWVLRSDGVLSGNQTIVKQFTARSEHKEIQLSDGTHIQLNASSTLDFPEKFSKNKREVWLSGEAFFDVKHADKWPFIIHTGKVMTTVLGTAFDVKAYRNSRTVSVSVKRGKVSVLNEKQLVATLIKGESVQVNLFDNSLSIANVKKQIAADNVGAWQQGYLVYEDERLEDIVNDLERTYNVSIAIKRPQLNNLLITSSFQREIGAVRALKIICNLTDTHFILDKQQFVIN